ncbi:Uncharacterised protein [Segatella copri]|nr:Uncharacterised protein [Segatella copri]
MNEFSHAFGMFIYILVMVARNGINFFAFTSNGFTQVSDK